jgi:hypothetical protein
MIEKWVYYKDTPYRCIISKLLKINDIIEVKQHPLFSELFYIYSSNKKYLNSMMITSNVLFEHFIKLSDLRNNSLNILLNNEK